MSRTTSNTSAVAGTATSGLLRNLSIKTTAKPPQFLNPLPPSDVKLFVTNLRLIDLDLRPDWPDITVQTFSSRNADQKQRIGGVEWALFRLFEIWDPAETSQKLQPFFPPLEPLQSLNLRAALYRCLNELKKNGVLGRETVLRKTMLDECKGDKFFEVLAFFSNAVLKKTLAVQSGNKKRTGIATVVSTATTLSHDKQASLLPLAIAHKAALVNVLRKKEEKRKRFTEFEATLNAKRDKINQRLKQCKATPRSRNSVVPEKEVAAIKKQLKDNWIGNQKWLDTMLHGDDVQAEDAFLSGHFQDVWHMVEKGQKLEDVALDAGLLENLQSRIQEQQTRLQKWKNFHETMLKEETKSSTSASNVPPPAKEVRFDDHLQLQLCSSKTSETELVHKGLPPEYQNIVSDMEAELARIAKAKHNRSDPPQLRRRASSLKAGRSPERKRKLKSESASSKPAMPSKTAKPAPPARTQSKDKIQVRPLRQDSAIMPIGSDTTLVGQPTTSPYTITPTSQQVDSLTQIEPENFKKSTDPFPEESPSSPPPSIRSPIPPRSPSPSFQPTPYIPSEPPILLPPTLTHEEAIAEAIISSIGNATPSPMKKPQPRLSLADRTRMSMAHTTSFPPITESPPSPPSPSLPVFEPPTLQPDRRATLHERTMLSMAAMVSNSRQSLAPQQSRYGGRKSAARTSTYPVNQFDTPQTQKSVHVVQGGEVTPKEELFSDDVDYERIFKSRPKIATSPIFSPVGMRGEEEDEFDEGVTGVDLGDVDADSDEENDAFSRDWENSPSKKGRLFG